MSLVKQKRRTEGTIHEDEKHVDLDLRSMKGFSSTWKNCHFVDCNFDLSDLRASKFEDCQFSRCSFRLVNFATSSFEKVTFFDCDLEQASFMGTMLRLVTFAACRMSYGDVLFQDATVKAGVLFRGCNLHGSNLDFREVPRNALAFENSNLWSAKGSMGCAFWNASLDERLIQQFIAILARTSQDARLVELAGDQYPIVVRAMDGRPKCMDQASTTSPATGSTQTQNSAVPMVSTASVATPEMAVSPMMSDGV